MGELSLSANESVVVPGCVHRAHKRFPLLFVQFNFEINMDFLGCDLNGARIV